MSSGLEDPRPLYELHLRVTPWKHKLRFPGENCSASLSTPQTPEV